MILDRHTLTDRGHGSVDRYRRMRRNDVVAKRTCNRSIARCWNLHLSTVYFDVIGSANILKKGVVVNLGFTNAKQDNAHLALKCIV